MSTTLVLNSHKALASGIEGDPEELFYILKHGIKLTGMPAFPVQNRDAEVWAVVAFLNELQTLDEDGYREWVLGSEMKGVSDVPHLVIERCARCHGLNGLDRDTSAFPKIAQLHPEYFIATMQAYATGTSCTQLLMV